VNNISKQTISDINKLITDKNNIVIIMHYNPDGDALGSALGLYHYLIKKSKTVTIISPNEYAECYNWMPNSDKIINFSTNKDTASKLISSSELLFFLDFNNLSRTENMEKVLSNSSAKKVLIDHHPNPGNIADIVISDTSVSSTAELIFAVLENINDNISIDKTIAECIYTGIMTDTGCFNYNSSQPYTFLVVSKLLEKKINKDLIYENLYNNFSGSRMQLYGYCLHKKMEIIPEYHTAFISLTKKELQDFNFKNGDTEGFVNLPLSIKNIKFSAIFIEKDEQIKISFRSTGNFPTNIFSSKNFNGGGHKNASGGYSKLTLSETINLFKSLLPKYKTELSDEY